MVPCHQHFGHVDVVFVDGTRKRIHFFASRLKWSRCADVTIVGNERVETIIRTQLKHYVGFGGRPLFGVWDRPRTIAHEWISDGVITEWNQTFINAQFEIAAARPRAGYARELHVNAGSCHPRLAYRSHMRTIASLVLVVGVACTQTMPAQPTLPELYAKRERASNKRTLSIVGTTLGVVATIAGIALAAHGADVRSRESSADDESGLGALLGGVLLCSGGGVLAIGSGISLVISNRELAEIDAQSRAQSARATR